MLILEVQISIFVHAKWFSLERIFISRGANFNFLSGELQFFKAQLPVSGIANFYQCAWDNYLSVENHLQ